MKTQKNESTAGKLVSYAASIAICWVFIPLLEESASGLNSGVAGAVALTAASFLVSVVLSVLFHESGHMIAGLLTGYSFSSFRLGSFMLVLRDGKLSLKRHNLPGTGGQCLMAPPEPDGNGRFPVALYNLGGGLAGLIAGGVNYLLYLRAQAPAARLFFCINSVMELLLSVTNLIPMRSKGLSNDGQNIIDLTKDPKALRAFWVQLKASSLSVEGVRTGNMPEEWFGMPSEEDIGSNSIIASLAVFRCDRLMDLRRFDEHSELAGKLIDGNNAVMGIHRSLLTCDKITADLLRGDRSSDEKYYTPALISFMGTMRNYPTVITSQYAHYLLAKKDPAKAREVRERFVTASERFPFPGDIEAAKELLDMIDSKYRAGK